MLTFKARPFLELMGLINTLAAIEMNPESAHIDSMMGATKGTLKLMRERCVEMELPISVAKAEVIERAIPAGFDSESIRRQLQELCDIVILEIDNANTYFIMPAKAARYYADADRLFGADIASAFPSTIVEVEEAGKCLALERGTACVFHLMRVMEVGLKGVANALKIPYAPSWEAYLNQIDTKIRTKYRTKSVKWRRDEPFFRDVSAHLHSVKAAWRNPTMHIVRVYTVEQAEEVFQSVRTFMRHLSTRLHE